MVEGCADTLSFGCPRKLLKGGARVAVDVPCTLETQGKSAETEGLSLTAEASMPRP